MNRIKWIFLLFIGLGSCATRAPVIVPDKPVLPETEQYIAEEFSAESARDYITIIAGGDNLYHAVMVQAGEGGDYESAYSEIRSLVMDADIAFINQETLLAGTEFGFSGFPLFNSPQKLGEALAAVGFNVVNHANNHVMDKGEKAVFATMDFWDTIPEVTVLGIHRSAEERNLPKLISKNNITVGFLSYTYGTNGIALPKDKPYLVSLINTEIMKNEIEALRPLCDFLVVSMHWGSEYQHNHSKNQETLAAFLAEQMVDLVIAHHPHVIQPVEYIERKDGTFMLCYYSLGNFISAQTRIPTMLGAMAYVKIGRPIGPEKPGIVEAGVIPVVTHYEKDYTNFKVYPLYMYSDELAAKHRINRNGMEMTMSYFNELSSGIFAEKEIKRNPFTE